jgi:hypothetical protein
MSAVKHGTQFMARSCLCSSLLGLMFAALPQSARAQDVVPAAPATEPPVAPPDPAPPDPDLGAEPEADTSTEGPASVTPAPTAPTGVPSAEVDANAAASADAEADAVAAALAGAMGGDGAEAALAEAEEFKLNLYGFTDFTYTHLLNDFTFASPYPTFLVGNVNLYVGAELGDGFRSLTEFRLLYLPHGSVPASEVFAPEPTRTDTTVGDPADLGRPQRWGGVEIERAWLEYSFDPLLTIQGGQWLTPYGIWNVDHGSPVIIGVRRPYVVGEGLIPERQTGIQIYGSYLVGTTELGYHLGLSNGRGPLDAYQDLDNNKAVTARLFVTSELPIGSITLGGTLFRGRYTDRVSRFAITPAGEFGLEYISVNRYEELSMAGDVRWLWDELTLQGELMVRDTALDDRYRAASFPVPGAPPGFAPDFRSVGWYVMGAYRLPWYNIMPFFGGESYDPGQGFAANAVWGGLNVRPTPRVVLKVQLTKSWFPNDEGVAGDDGIEVLDLQAAWSF